MAVGGGLLIFDMNTITIKSSAGDNFNAVAEKAKVIAKDKNTVVEFDFNTIRCLVDKNTNLDWLWRDYANAHRMDWKEVGSDCVAKYDNKIQAELDKRNKLAEEKESQRQVEYEAKCDKEKEVLAEKTKGIEIELSDPKLWEQGLAKNTDPYGRCAYEYAENWAKLMQVEMSQGKTLIECAEKTSHELGYLGITGFMYGCAVNVLSHCWKHGEELRKWHNKEYDHEGDGVVNPAILTLG